MNTLKIRRLANGRVGRLLLRLHRLLKYKVTDPIWNHKFIYDPFTDIGRTLYFTGGFEEHELRLCAKYIPPDAVVLDIGANIGLHSVYFAHLVPQGHVLAFEPAIETFQLLAKNVAGIRNISLLNLAISDVGGLVNFFVASDNAYSSLMDTKRKSILNTIKVPCMKLDDVIAGLNIRRLDFIKIDVEGLEHNVINGMRQVILQFKPIIFCEIFAGQNSNSDPEGTVRLVCSGGYSAHVMRNGGLFPYESHDDNFYNYLFLPMVHEDQIRR